MQLATREQLAKMLGFTRQHLHNLNFLPMPVKKKRNIGFYDLQESIKRYHEKRDELTQQKVATNMVQEVIKNVKEVTQAAKNNPGERLKPFTFISGQFDRPDQKNQCQLKKLASKTTKPKTQKVQLFDDWDSPRKRHHKLYK